MSDLTTPIKTVIDQIDPIPILKLHLFSSLKLPHNYFYMPQFLGQARCCHFGWIILFAGIQSWVTKAISINIILLILQSGSNQQDCSERPPDLKSFFSLFSYILLTEPSSPQFPSSHQEYVAPSLIGIWKFNHCCPEQCGKPTGLSRKKNVYFSLYQITFQKCINRSQQQ